MIFPEEGAAQKKEYPEDDDIEVEVYEVAETAEEKECCCGCEEKTEE